jgi:hypothetical protein
MVFCFKFTPLLLDQQRQAFCILAQLVFLNTDDIIQERTKARD